MPDSPLVNLPHEWLTSMPLERLALKLQGHPDGAWMVQQVEGWRTLSQKVPLWAQTAGIEYPPRQILSPAILDESQLETPAGINMDY